MNQSNSPAFYSQPLNSNNPPSILQPQSVNSIQQPHSVNSLQQPHSVNSIQQPHSVSNIQQPHSVSNLQQPGSVSNLQQPGSVSNLQQPGSVSNLQQPGSVSNLQQPGSVGNLQQPGSVSNLQQPHSVNSLTTSTQNPLAASGPSHTINLDFSNSTTNVNQFDLNSLVSTFQYEFGQDETPEPITKSKELMNQLKLALQNLLSQLAFILNPSNEFNKQLSDNQFQLLGKHIENFYKTCDLLTVNLRAGCEAQILSTDLRNFYRYYAHMDHTDQAKNEGQMRNSMNIQMQRIGDLKNLLQKFLVIKEHEPFKPVQQGHVHQNQPQIHAQQPFQPQTQPQPQPQPLPQQQPQQQAQHQSQPQQQMLQQQQQQQYPQQQIF